MGHPTCAILFVGVLNAKLLLYWPVIGDTLVADPIV